MTNKNNSAILLLVTMCTMLSSFQPVNGNFTPENTVFLTDLDNVLIKTSSYQIPNLIFQGITKQFFNSLSYLRGLHNLKNAYSRDDRGVRIIADQDNQPINGSTLQLLYQGMNDPNLTPYVGVMAHTISKSCYYNDGTTQIYNHFKSQGYPIIGATNKDGTSYALLAARLGQEFTSLADPVFVPQDSTNLTTIKKITEFAQKASTPQDYKDLVSEMIKNGHSTDHLRHVPYTKPSPEYYTFIYKSLEESGMDLSDKHIIFIDDKEKNVQGFLQSQPTTNATLHGILFKDPVQLSKELSKLGVPQPK